MSAQTINPLQRQTVTREELFRQVWETPMSRLAIEYGLSGNGLAKICDRMNIPYPPRGYWAKVAAGQKVVKYRLPPIKEGIPSETVIRPSSPAEKPPTPAPEVQEAIDTARSEATDIVIGERLLRPHRVIAAWLDEYERKLREARRERNLELRRWMIPDEFTESDRRRHRLLDALFKALEKRGGVVRQGERRELIADINGEPIEFAIREKQKKGRRPLTDFEKQYATRDDKGWRHSLVATGMLAFAIKTYLPGKMRQEWVETEDKPMETLLPDIVATFVAAGPLLVEQRKQREEAERQRLLAERRRYEEQQRKKKDDNRWRKFVQFAEQHREAAIARAFLEALKSTEIDPAAEFDGKTVAEWISWAEQRLGTGDPLNAGPEAVFRVLAGVTEWSS